jgi:hypothetical protein
MFDIGLKPDIEYPTSNIMTICTNISIVTLTYTSMKPVGRNTIVLLLSSINRSAAFKFLSLKPGLLAIGFLLLLLNGCKTKSFGTTISATGNGNWENPGTWSAGRAPVSNDTITIAVNRKVTLTSVTAEYANMLVMVSGTLHFNSGKKLRMCEGKVEVASGGKLEADNSGSKIDICTNMAWDGNDGGDGPLTIVNPNPLPVVLADAKAITANGAVTIAWATASEIKCDHYSVQRSKNGEDFYEIAAVKGAGNSTSALYYSYTDFEPYTGNSYYRLMQINYNGKTELLKMFAVKMNTKFVALYPNPISISEKQTIELDVPGEGVFTVTAVDKNGKEVFSLACTGAEEKKLFMQQLQEAITSAGIYSVQIRTRDEAYYKRLAVVE